MDGNGRVAELDGPVRGGPWAGLDVETSIVVGVFDACGGGGHKAMPIDNDSDKIKS